jgi:cobalt-zinc-cadmium efflux system outer membrane protein
MTRSDLAVLAASMMALGACAAPEPLRLADLDVQDQRFVSARTGDAPSLIDDVLKKDELSLQDLLALADRLNPELASERKGVDVAIAGVWEARLYPNPSLLLEIEDYRTREISDFGSSKRLAGISIPIVVSGRIGAATSAAEKERDAAAVAYVWKRREILSQVKRAYVSVLAARRTAELARETRNLTQTLHDVTNERFKAQAVPEMELLKAAISLAKSDIDLKLAQKDEAVSLKTLHAAVGNSELTQTKLSGELFSRFAVPSFEVLKGQVTTVHPLLEAAQRRKEAAELERDVARSERIPDLGFDLLAGRDSADQTIIEAGLSVPLPIFNRNQAKIARAEARIEQAKFSVDAVRNDLLLRLNETYRTFVASQERGAVYQDDILPKAEKAFTQTSEGYKLGKFGYLDLLDAQRTLAEARMAYAAALADLNLSATELEKLTGTRLEPIR